MYTNRLRELCDVQGLTWYDLYKRAGLARGTVRALYKRWSHIPSPPVARQLASYLNVEPLDLITWVEGGEQ